MSRRHDKLILLPHHLSLLFSLTEPLHPRTKRPKRDLMRRTLPYAGLPAVHEQEHLNNSNFTQTNGLVEMDYDQVLALIESYVQE